MEEKTFKILGELIEHSSHASELLISGEIALNDGELEASQKANIDAQNLISTMKKDIFEEIKKELNTTCDKVDDYDIPTTLELAKQLTKISNNAGVYINVILDAQNSIIKGIVANKIITSINTVVEIFDAIFNN